MDPVKETNTSLLKEKKKERKKGKKKEQFGQTLKDITKKGKHGWANLREDHVWLTSNLKNKQRSFKRSFQLNRVDILTKFQ